MQSANFFAEFNPDLEEIDAYFDRFECFVVCNAITDVNKVRFLIASVGAKTYSKLRLLAVPKTPLELTYAEIKNLLKAEFQRTPLVHVAQHSFRHRLQKEGESFRDFYNALKELSRDCGFTTPDRLKEELKAQIISGIRDRKTQSYYFMQKNLTLEEVVAKAEIDELAVDSIDHLRKPANVSQSVESVNKISEPVRRKPQFQKRSFRGRRGAGARSDRQPASNAASHQPESSAPAVVCYRCAKPGHKAPSCFHRNSTCSKCNRQGHIAPACGKSRENFRASAGQSSSSSNLHQIEPYEIVPLYALQEQPAEVTRINRLRNRGNVDVVDPSSKIMLQIRIEGKSMMFEADSGSKYAVMSKSCFERLGLKLDLHPAYVILQTYSRDYVNVIGCVYVTVSYCNVTVSDLRLLLVDGDYDAVLGREWLTSLKVSLDFGATESCINVLPCLSFDLKPALETLALEFRDLFEDAFSTLKDVTFHVNLRPNSTPIFCRHRTIVFSQRDAVNREIDRLVENKIYTPVASSDWATPLVIVPKANNKVRLVGDYSVTLNTCIIPEEYPIPNVEEIVYDFQCCHFYSKFDVREAYMHMAVTSETAKLLTVNTPRGLFQVNRMNYGVQSAPAKWQRYVETTFKSVPGCRCFYDDIKISSTTEHKHLASVKQFFQICRENGIKLRKEKCQLLTNELEYLGFKVNSQGVHKTAAKVTAILNAPQPKTITEVKSFAGLVGFYGRFVPNMSALFHPINMLLRKDTPFVWSRECQEAFDAIKREIASPRVLCHFDPAKKLILATDASPYAIGAVLSHEVDLGERPIAFASRALSRAEQNYSQVDKESLAIFWGVKRFFNYLFGRRFTLFVDCKPLQAIFAKNVAMPALSATRLLHYAIFLQGFDYEIRYRRSSDYGNADFLSRFPVESEPINCIDEPAVLNIHQISMLPISAEELAKETASDPETAALLRKLRDEEVNNQPEAEGNSLARFSIERDCILMGTRVFVPRKFRVTVLQELHMGHIGAGKMKGLARTYVYWPGIDGEIEQLVKRCRPCQANANTMFAPLHPWMQPNGPWERVHVDYAGPFLQYSFLIVVDAFSKWPEVFPIPSSRVHGTTSAATIEKLRECFSRFGCPTTLVSDNGVQFVSTEFRTFCRENFIKQLHSAPHFPQSNGQVERFVQTIKRALKIAVTENPQESLTKKLQVFLMAYRRAPIVGLNKSPAQLMLNRNIRTRIDILASAPLQKENQQHSNDLQGKAVWFKSFQQSKNWEQGEVIRQHGDVMVDVRDENGTIHRRHKSQIRRDYTNREATSTARRRSGEWPIDQPPPPVEVRQAQIQQHHRDEHEQLVAATEGQHEAEPVAAPEAEAVNVRRSNRERRNPNRFSP